MGDDEYGKLIAEAFDSVHDGLFGFVVEGAGGFVEDDDACLLVEGPSDADALALASGEADAAFANIGLILLRPAFDDVGNLCLAGGLLDTIVVDFRFWNAKGDVVFDGAVSEEDGLGHMGNMCLPCPVVVCA